MAWEARSRGRGRYYTRSRKVAGRVVREYVGVGPVAELAAAADALRRADRRAALEALRAEKASRLSLFDWRIQGPELDPGAGRGKPPVHTDHPLVPVPFPSGHLTA